MTEAATRQLGVLRHAKAAPHQADDHARPLTGRGRRQCAELAAHLAEAGRAEAMPQVVLVSSAARALETAHLVTEALGGTARLEVEPSLYQAGVDVVLELLRALDDAVPSVMVVGHNPTLEELVWVLVQGDDKGRSAYDGLSTGALAVVGLEAPSWEGTVPASGRLLSLYAPTAR